MEQPINIADLDQGLDRDLLIKLKKRFLAISEERLARTRLSLNDRQQLVLDTLASLFHFNHPALPGYVSHQTPARISNFELNNRTKLAIKRLSRSFNFNEPAQRETDIYAIYIMGSVGTIAHGSRSDLDVWVCYRPGISATAIRLLTHKGERIARWAHTMGVEVHCFPMDCEAFKSGRAELLDEESSGSSQHYLLLDEFYRTAIWLGGRIPLWWFVPPECEHNYDYYADILVHKQFVRPKEVLDFGSSAQIPPGEYVGAGIWHLYKGIDSPYKSVLKLLLLEVYASRHPHNEPLSVDFKRQVYRGETELDTLDAYFSLYQHLQQYLTERKELKRLDLIRRAFYFKVHCPLTRQQSRIGWQWQALNKLVQEWGWGEKALSHMDNRKHWKAGQVKLEKHHLVHELITSYRFISHFASGLNAKNSIDQQELETLGHKLHAAFDRKAGKIELINPDISGDLSESMLMVRFRADRPSNERWSVYAMPDRRSSMQRNLLLKQASHLNEILCWCLANLIHQPLTEILVEGTGIRTSAVRQYISSLQACFHFPLDKAKHADFLAPSRLTKVFVFANLMTVESSEDNATITASNQDAFCFGDQSMNLIDSLDVVYCNSWNEIVCLSFHDDPLQQFAQQYLQLCSGQEREKAPELYIFSARSHQSPLITSRLQEFLSDFNEAIKQVLLSRSGTGLNFIFQSDQRFHLVHSNGRRSVVDSFATAERLIEAVQKPHAYPTRWATDSRALPDNPLKLVLSHAGIAGIKVFFYLPAENRARVYFVDDWQNVTLLQFPFGRLPNLLQSLHQFIRCIITQSLATHYNQENSFGVYPVAFFRISRDQGRWLNCEPVSVDTQLAAVSHFEVKAIAEPTDDDAIYYRFICDQQELEGDQEEQISAVVEFIRSRRNIGEHYPFHLSDLDLSRCRYQLTEGGELKLGDFLRVKNELEQRINSKRLKYK